MNTLFKAIFNVELREVAWRVQLPESWHTPYNRFILTLLFSCLAWKILETLKFKLNKTLDKAMRTVFGVYLCSHSFLLTIETVYTSIIVRAPSMALHHVIAILMFLHFTLTLKKFWVSNGPLTFVPFVMHCIAWSNFFEMDLIPLYNLTLAISGINGLAINRKTGTFGFWVLSLVSCNYWTYCDEYRGSFCLGPILGLKRKNRLFSYASNFPAFFSGILFCIFLCLFVRLLRRWF